MILSEPAGSNFSATVGTTPTISPFKTYATSNGFASSPQSSAVTAFYNPSTIGNPATGYLSPFTAGAAVNPAVVVSNETAIGGVTPTISSSAGFTPLLPPSYVRSYTSDTSKCSGLSSLYGVGQYPTPPPHLSNSLVSKLEASAAADAKVPLGANEATVNYAVPPSTDAKIKSETLSDSPPGALSTDSSSACNSATSSPKQPYLTASSRTKAPPKKRPLPVPEENKDQQYWEKRKKNNDSAKRSRDLRRQKEERTQMNALILQEENTRLRTEIDYLRKEIESLKYMLFHAT